MFAHGEVVTVRRGTLVDDPYSSEDTVLDWDDPVEVDVPGCGVALGSTIDPLMDARDAVVSDFVVYAPASAEVFASDRLVVRGLVCEVVGNPFVWMNPFTGWTPGLVVKANIVEG